jgi:hypothetical protein
LCSHLEEIVAVINERLAARRRVGLRARIFHDDPSALAWLKDCPHKIERETAQDWRAAMLEKGWDQSINARR